MQQEFATWIHRHVSKLKEWSIIGDIIIWFNINIFWLISRIEYTSKKGKIGGDKRKMSFTIGDSDKMILKASGIINKDATVFIGSGLPNTTSKYVFF